MFVNRVLGDFHGLPPIRCGQLCCTCLFGLCFSSLPWLPHLIVLDEQFDAIFGRLFCTRDVVGILPGERAAELPGHSELTGQNRVVVLEGGFLIIVSSKE